MNKQKQIEENYLIKTGTLMRGLALCILIFFGAAVVLGIVHSLAEVAVAGVILVVMVGIDIKRARWWKWL